MTWINYCVDIKFCTKLVVRTKILYFSKSPTFQDFILCWCRMVVSSFYLLFCPSVIIAHQCVQPNVFYNGTQIKHHTNIHLAQTYVFKVINSTNIVKWPDIIDAKQLNKCRKKFDLFWTHGWQAWVVLCWKFFLKINFVQSANCWNKLMKLMQWEAIARYVTDDKTAQIHD